MPLGIDQGVGAVVWSPLGWGRLTGKIRRGAPLPETSRLRSKLAVDKGLMSPPTSTQFNPNAPLTRAELARGVATLLRMNTE